MPTARSAYRLKSYALMEFDSGSTRKEGVAIDVNEPLYFDIWSLVYEQILFQI